MLFLQSAKPAGLAFSLVTSSSMYFHRDLKCQIHVSPMGLICSVSVMLCVCVAAVAVIAVLLLLLGALGRVLYEVLSSATDSPSQARLRDLLHYCDWPCQL